MKKNRKPLSHPRKTPSHIEKVIISHRKKHLRWGGEKIWKLLHKDFKQEEIPCISTVNRIIKRNGLIVVRKRRPRVKPVCPVFNPQACNEVWSADFKGKFRMGNRKYCHPLTIADSYSRYLFTAKGLYGERFIPTKQEFKRIFREYGKPRQIHTDNGRHERMHRDLKGEATRPPAYNLRAQQRKLNRFVYEYNNERPHAALELETPESVHMRSRREYRDKVEEWFYPAHFQVRRVCKNGALRWRSTKRVMVTTSLSGKDIGLEEIGTGIWRVFFRQKLLEYFEEQTLRIQDEIGRLKRNYV